MKFHSHRISLTATCLALAGTVHAYPPAPGVVVRGVVRDEYGWVMRVENAEVVFKQGIQVVGRAPIAGQLNFDYNYEILLPVDSGLTPDPYRKGAMLLSSGYTVEIHVAGAIYLPIEVLTQSLPTPQPSTTMNLDLTLGEDTDGDGLPDDWELWQLQIAEIYPGDPRYNLDQLSKSGDYDRDGISDFEEFLAGSFAVSSSSFLRLDVIGFHSPTQVEFEWNSVRDKSYELEASSDLQSWDLIEAQPYTPINSPVALWTATQNGRLKLYAPPQGPRRFYRLRVR